MSPFDEDPAIRARLTAYLDDRLSPGEAREFLAWLERHPAAWKEAEESRRVWALLAAYRDEAVPDGFADRVMARLRAEGLEPVAAPASVASARPTLALLAGGRAKAVAAAAAIVMALGVGVLSGWLASRGSSDAGSVAPTVEALNAMPVDLLDRMDGDDVAQIASLSDEEFEALLAPSDENGKGSGG